MPEVGTRHSAAPDLHALFSYIIPAGHQVEVRTGVALDFVIKHDEKAKELQRLANFLSNEENVQELKIGECKSLRSSLIKSTLKKKQFSEKAHNIQRTGGG